MSSDSAKMEDIANGVVLIKCELFFELGEENKQC